MNVLPSQKGIENTKKTLTSVRVIRIPVVGVEPTLQRNTILSRARLPIPPHRHIMLEAPVGIEPTIEELQSSALPLGYGAKKSLERKTGFEPATPTLARSYSTTELLPQNGWAGRDRTFACRNQNPMPYHLATAQ